jgi:hypothetical protein
MRRFKASLLLTNVEGFCHAPNVRALGRPAQNLGAVGSAAAAEPGPLNNPAWETLINGHPVHDQHGFRKCDF